jgi:GNAT superfamily N-acetyltransferase
MCSAFSQFATEVQLPLHSRRAWGVESGSDDWVSELQEMRGRVLYDGGRRPKFLKPDGTYADEDLLDAVSFHVIVRAESRMVGCTRVTPLSPGVRGVVESIWGEARFRCILAEIGEPAETTAEASRWMVVPELRGHGLGFHLIAASWAVARWLGVRTVVAAAGSRDSQDRTLVKLGARSVDAVPLIPSDEFDDELHILHFDIQNPSLAMVRWVDRMTTALGLDCLLDENFAGKGSERTDLPHTTNLRCERHLDR